MEANKTADGVLALEKAVATLQREAKEVDGEFERKLLEVEADATVIQEVGPRLPCLAPFPVNVWARLHLTAASFPSSDSSGSSEGPCQGWPGRSGRAGDVEHPGRAAASDE